MVLLELRRLLYFLKVDASHFINYDIYTNAFSNNKFGRASAEAWILFLIIMVFTVIIFRKSEQYVYYENE